MPAKGRGRHWSTLWADRLSLFAARHRWLSMPVMLVVRSLETVEGPGRRYDV
jgi:hypothetical protein